MTGAGLFELALREGNRSAVVLILMQSGLFVRFSCSGVPRSSLLSSPLNARSARRRTHCLALTIASSAFFRCTAAACAAVIASFVFLRLFSLILWILSS
jgi:hypothetical protein